MKFYDRIQEFDTLKKADNLKSSRSVMTIITGRRRVGKTTLTLQNFTNDSKLYFFVSKKEESLLCDEFVDEIKERLDVPVYGKISQFEDIFKMLLDFSKKHPITLIIDEFQEFFVVNPSIYSSMQKLWDLNKDTSKLHLILCGSKFSLMKKIFEDYKEPLFGRADFRLNVEPLEVSVLAEILDDKSMLNNKNLLDFYILTGGVAKYIELFVLYNAFDRDSMVSEIIKENSLFLDEGKNRLIEEFGREYKVYFSILSLIANSKTSKNEIEGILEKNISGYLYRLENDYDIIRSIKPINAKEGSKRQKYEIVDNFLFFWFRFIYKYQSVVEADNFERLRKIVLRDFDTFSGKFLEKIFIEYFRKQQKYSKIGSYWERNNENEIDIVALNDEEKKIIFCEVKLSENKLDKKKLEDKSRTLLKKYGDYKVEYKLLSLKDINLVYM
ncbi:ATP-binding protein [Flexistipes sp.]|uniref:ATP-binding protein n=1 Tax=Flexistipes sp. TaxID=3088135 RepID=UPI002E1BE5D5|nr:DUF234 domain-containing protein [Flexistipes sp.]